MDKWGSKGPRLSKYLGRLLLVVTCNIAHLVEQQTHNLWVGGSNPSVATNNITDDIATNFQESLLTKLRPLFESLGRLHRLQ